MSHASHNNSVPGGVEGKGKAIDEGAISTQSDGDVVKATTALTIEDSDEQSIETKSDGTGAYSGKSKDGRGFQPMTYSPPQLRSNGSPFIKGRSHSEDPFATTSATRRAFNASTGNSPKSARIRNSSWRSGDNSTPTVSANPSPVQKGVIEVLPGKNSFFVDGVEFVPRQVDQTEKTIEGYYAKANPEFLKALSKGMTTTYPKVTYPQIRDGAQLPREDAQSHYPPSCCVFVANLLQSESDKQLELAVTEIFKEFGIVFVKIRRDSKQMPFAFCQFTNPEDASQAIEFGRGRLIFGRPCRCEKAKAHRIFLLQSKFGPPATTEDAFQLLSRFGNIEKCYVATAMECGVLNITDGIVVQFSFYNDGQDAQMALRHHDLYKFAAVQNLSHTPRGFASSYKDVKAQLELDRYAVDRRSIFCGNLPASATQDQVRDIFHGYGEIANVIMRETTAKNESSFRPRFAFVEFKKVDAAMDAVKDKNGAMYCGKNLKVELKHGNSNRQFALHRSPALESPYVQTSPMASHSEFTYNWTVPASPQYMYHGTPAGLTPDSAIMGHGYPLGYQPYVYSPVSPNNHGYAADGSPYDPCASFSPSTAPSTVPSEFTGSPGGHVLYGSPLYSSTPYWDQNMEPQSSAGLHPPASFSVPTSNVNSEDRSSTPIVTDGAVSVAADGEDKTSQ